MKYKELTEKSSVVPIEFTTECAMVFRFNPVKKVSKLLVKI